MAKRPRIGDVFRVRMGPDEYRDFVLGPDIDLDKEVILDDHGERINDAWIEREVAKMRHLRSSVGGSQE